jgi:hypothetical protein
MKRNMMLNGIITVLLVYTVLSALERGLVASSLTIVFMMSTFLCVIIIISFKLNHFVLFLFTIQILHQLQY